MAADKPVVWVSYGASKVPDHFKDMFKKYFKLVYYDEAIADPELANKIHGAFYAPVHEPTAPVENYTQFPIKVLANWGVGVDHLDIRALNEKGIRVTNVPGVIGPTAADMAFGLMLASSRQLLKGTQLAMGPEPQTSPMDLGQDVCGSTLGIVGMGSIGLEVAKRGKGFNMTILYHNRNRRSEEDEKSVGATYCPDLHDMLRRSDFVVLSFPCTESTINLIDKKALSCMKNTASLVNVARGKVVNTDDLVQALQNGTIRSAGLDVTEPEPLPPGHPLTTLPNVTVVPHWASATVQCRERMTALCIENLRAGIEGRPLLTEVIRPS